MKKSTAILLFLTIFCFNKLEGQKDPKLTIAKVIVYKDGIKSIGSGIIVGQNQQNNEVSVVTALHVLEERNGTYVGDPDSIFIEFRNESKRFKAKFEKAKPDVDVALISVIVPKSSITFVKREISESSDFDISLVQAIGNPQGSDWVLSSQKYVTRLDSSHFSLSHDGRNKWDGFSGGGVFTKKKRLMGMILQNRSHDIKAIDIFTITALLATWKVEPNLLIPPKMKILSPLMIVAGAAGSVVAITQFENKSRDLYEIYETNRFPSNQEYIDLGKTRDDVYKEANSKHHTAVIIGAVSGVVLVSGAIILIKKLTRKSKERKHDGLAVYPHFDMPNYVFTSGQSVSFGVTFQF